MHVIRSDSGDDRSEDFFAFNTHSPRTLAAAPADLKQNASIQVNLYYYSACSAYNSVRSLH